MAYKQEKFISPSFGSWDSEIRCQHSQLLQAPIQLAEGHSLSVSSHGG